MSTESPEDRKACPNCGYSSRASAKVCSRCGYAFQYIHIDGRVRKRCQSCGYGNRIAAKVCSRCGSVFRGADMVSRGSVQKWCPQCGRARRPGAKVCADCGYHFKAAPLETPIIQSAELADTPVTPSELEQTAVVPRLPVTEPAPYLSDDELNALRRTSIDQRDLFIRFFNLFRRLKS